MIYLSSRLLLLLVVVAVVVFVFTTFRCKSAGRTDSSPRDCAKCGTANSARAKFCRRCGGELPM